MKKEITTFDDLGKIPPQAIEIEEAVLGALMLENTYHDEIINELFADIFYKEIHQLIFNAILQLYLSNNPIDILTVTQQLTSTNELDTIGGPYYITQLTNRVASAANIQYHVKLLIEKWHAREQIRIHSQSITSLYDTTNDTFDIYDNSLSELEKLNITIEGNKPTVFFSDQLSKTVKKFEARELAAKNNEVLGIPTGFIDLDKITGGWLPDDLIIIAGRPSMGKTAITLEFAKNAAKKKYPGCFFSLEMSCEKLIERIVLGEYDFDYNNSNFAARLKKGYTHKQDWQSINEIISRINDIPLFIDDQPVINLMNLKSKLRIAKKLYNIRWAAIDYFQLISMVSKSKNANREQIVSETSRGLKLIARELHIPLLVVSQLSREVEKRGGEKRPILSDLRESGAIEQDADLVIFPYRAEYYIKGAEDERGNSLNGVMELIIAKHRNGITTSVFLNHNETINKFWDFNVDGREMPDYKHQI